LDKVISTHISAVRMLHSSVCEPLEAGYTSVGDNDISVDASWLNIGSQVTKLKMPAEGIWAAWEHWVVATLHRGRSGRGTMPLATHPSGKS
jgi:hypothetical protein